MNVLIDIGNSRLKWGVENRQGMQFRGVIEYRREAMIDIMSSAWRDLNPPDAVAISSVASKQIVYQLLDLARSLWPGAKIIIASSSSTACGVTNAYKQPERLGIDRWLNLLALRHYYPGNACVIDCGTAITLDFLNEAGQHSGGLISPGLQLMKQSLTQGTSELPFSEVEPDLGLADHTEAAIYCGTLYSAVGLIERVLAEQNYPQVVMTGGDASLIARNLAVRSIFEPDFVLKGLALYCSENR